MRCGKYTYGRGIHVEVKTNTKKGKEVVRRSTVRDINVHVEVKSHSQVEMYMWLTIEVVTEVEIHANQADVC